MTYKRMRRNMRNVWHKKGKIRTSTSYKIYEKSNHALVYVLLIDFDGVRALCQGRFSVNRGRCRWTGFHSNRWEDVINVLVLWEFHAFRYVFDFDYENVLEATFYRNCKPRTEMMNESIDISIWFGSGDIVNIYYNDNLVVRTNRDTGIEGERNVTQLSKRFREVRELGEWCFLETIACHVESKNLSSKTHARWGYHPYFGNKVSIPECWLDIQLISIEAEMYSEGNDVTKEVMLRHGWTCLISVQAFDLRVTICYNSCLVLFNGSICIMFKPKYTLTTNRLSASREIRHVMHRPSSSFLDWLVLLKYAWLLWVRM